MSVVRTSGGKEASPSSLPSVHSVQNKTWLDSQFCNTAEHFIFSHP